MSKTNSDIVISITTDENKIPEKITWKTTEAEGGESRAVMLSIWDHKNTETLKIDLWDKEMTVEEMKKFVYQNLFTLCDSFERATNEKEMAKDMRKFAQYFGEEMKVIKPLKS
ncbi:MAG: gliding motility protein GldC [Luteibaculaceae bacterium]